MRVLGKVERATARAVDSLSGRLDALDTPLILEGCIESWPARRADGWDAEGLTRRIGGLRTRCKRSSTHRHPDFADPSGAGVFTTEESTFADLIARMTQGPPGCGHYFLTGDEECLLERRPGQPDRWSPHLDVLRADYTLPDLFDPETLYTIWLWMSGRGVRSWLHYDTNGCHNLNAQVRGSKRIWLFPPHELPRLYPFGLGGPVPAHNCCQVDIEAPDLDRFPRFEAAQCLEGELYEGDLLFLPADWIHSLLHTGRFNVNVNFWWRPARLRHTPVSVRRAFLDGVHGLPEGAVSRDVLEALATLDRSLVSTTAGEAAAPRLTALPGPRHSGRVGSSSADSVTDRTSPQASAPRSVRAAATAWLEGFVSRGGGIAGTLHRLVGDQLVLEAAVNIPEPVQQLTRSIPRGKGMAGLAWERGVPVQTCNLQTDSSGDVRPGARAVEAHAAVALPVHRADGALMGVVGLAFADERTLEDERIARLSHDARGCLDLDPAADT